MKVVIVGAGFAGVSTAAALAERGGVTGLVVEREAIPGAHASGKNAGIARHVEFDPVVRALAVRSLALWATRRHDDRPLLVTNGGLYLAHQLRRPRLEEVAAALGHDGIAVEVLGPRQVLARWPYLRGVSVEAAAWCGRDGVADIHAMLLWSVERARAGGLGLRTRTPVRTFMMTGGRITGVTTDRETIEADVVVDATGAWAGTLDVAGGRSSAAERPGPLRAMQPVRRHLFTTSRPDAWPADAPVVWHLDEGFYLRPEAGGLLCSPCDESPHPPGDPLHDPAAEELLAEKFMRHGGGLADVEVHRGWPCLRTFAPDRRPVVGWDPGLPGLFHVGGLGGFGMTASAAIGELAACLLLGDPVDAGLADAVSPARLVPPAEAGADRPGITAPEAGKARSRA